MKNVDLLSILYASCKGNLKGMFCGRGWIYKLSSDSRIVFTLPEIKAEHNNKKFCGSF